MRTEKSEMEELTDLIAATRSLLLAEKSRGVHYFPFSPPESSTPTSRESSGRADAPKRRVRGEGAAHKPSSVKNKPQPNDALLNALTPALKELFKESSGCEKCALSQGRKNVVFGVGPNNADLLIVGEAPGAIEDVKGEPFVGPIGEMLDKMLVNVVGLSRDQVYLMNAVKCKMKGGKRPSVDEIEQCSGYLSRQIEAISPKVILCLGEAAAMSVVSKSEGLEELRGRWHEYGGVPVLVSYNPAYLLMHPKFKRPVFNDLKLLSAKYDELGGTR